MNNLVLAGNIELHIKTSDWVFHNHSNNPHYENIILHAVLHHDTEIAELENKNIPTLELKSYIDENLLWKYESLTRESQFIPCEKLLQQNKIPIHFHEENVLKKLEEKSFELEKSLEQYKNNFETVLFHSLAYSFGLKVNAFVFKQIAESVDFTVINKIRQNESQLEALLFGIAGWLDAPQDEQMNTWKREFAFVKVKFRIPDLKIHPKFSRLRPPNFPSIRLSQLANLYQQQSLFLKLIFARNTEELYEVFKNVKASEYWDNHFNFGKTSSINQPKTLSNDFIELVILNTILPLKYTYYKYHNEAISDEILEFYKSISYEKNSIITNWKKLGLKIATALESQSLIYHHKNSCEEKKCLNCSIGFKLLKDSSSV